MSDSYRRTQDKAQAMQVQHQNKIIRAASLRKGGDKREIIRNDRRMVKEAMAVKKDSSDSFTLDRPQANTSLENSVELARNENDTRRGPRNASERAARAQAQRQVQARRSPAKANSPQNIRQRTEAQRQYSPSDNENKSHIYSPAPQSLARPQYVQARRAGAVAPKDRPRVVRAHGISNTPSHDVRRARLLEEKLQAMSKQRK